MTEHTQTDLTDTRFIADGGNRVFEDCELGEDDILGTKTFENVLFTEDDSGRVVDVRTGNPPENSTATVEEAKQFAEQCSVNSITGEPKTPHVAKPLSVEAQIETQSRPFSACAFFHMSLTSHELHFAYNAAYKSDDYEVSFDADYDSGDLTITVEKAN